MDYVLTSELANYDRMLEDHLGAMIRGLRRLKPEHRDWTPDQAAPSCRVIAEHAWQWMVCDRQHITEPDASLHAEIPEAPRDSTQLCLILEQELYTWRELISSLPAELLDEPRFHFGIEENTMNIRSLIGHTIQNVVYKHGQFAVLFYALGYDGDLPYSAPLPNAIYAVARRDILATE